LSFKDTISHNGRRIAVAGTLAVLTAVALLAATARPAAASTSQWSFFEDHSYLIRSTPQVRDATLAEIKALGADSLRVEVKWNEVAPQPDSRSKPSFDATDPGAYPGFWPYDDLIQKATGMGFRIMITLAPDAPRWATAGKRGGNYKVSSTEFARFARAVGRRYSGAFSGVPAVRAWSLWNEPNHIFFIKPRSEAPRVYRRLVEKGLPALRATAPSGSKLFVGELAPVGTATKVIGPLRFLRAWLCLDNKYKRLRGSAARKAGCNGFKRVSASGFAHHPYGPFGLPPAKRDIVNISAIKRLAKALDLSARAGRITKRLAIYNTEFGFQTNPPDPFVSTSPTRAAQIINEKEEFSYRYSRLKSYSQYLLYDDPPRSGSAALRWAGFQTGLRLPGGALKPSYEAYKYPIVVRRRGRGVYVWGRVRPGKGIRYVQLERRSGSSWVKDGPEIDTNFSGYFKVNRSRRATYRFHYVTGIGGTTIGTSRAASPIK
jgi:hypothetical protein